MILAIHNNGRLGSWNQLWIEYCKRTNIPFIEVDCYSSDLIATLKKENVTHLMWAFSLSIPKDQLVAKSILNAVECLGIKVFPGFSNRWHFEDKIAQKYILESIGAPIVPSWAFYEEKDALKFSETTEYPLVAKLRKGAGSTNVILLHNQKEAEKYICRMFSKGYSPVLSASALSSKKVLSTNKTKRHSFKEIVSWLRAYKKRRNLFAKEKGYVYFQEFMPNNVNDLRIAVVGERIWGFYRNCRPNDFRASGSGLIDHSTPIPKEVLKCAYDLTKRLGTQSLGIDFVKAPDGSYKIVEMCYGYVSKPIFDCKGYWDGNLQFHEGHFMPEECILDDFIKS